MSPIRRIGPRCDRCNQRPAEANGICRPCDQLLHAFGHNWGPTGLERPRVVSVDDPGFEAELRAWRAGL